MSKRESLARVCASSGITRLVELLPQRPAVLALNYHRVGDWRDTPYDPALFSATAAEFDEQLRYLKRRFPIVDLPEALEMLAARRPLRRTAVLLTFDDGYLDNYQVAFPVLRSHGLSATFFLPTAFIGAGRLPWWDIIACQVRRSARPSIRFDRYDAAFDIAGDALRDGLRGVLDLYKRRGGKLEEFLADVTEATAVEPPGESAERCFLNWSEAREMQQHGMCFGSHTHNHEILSKLPAGRQAEELAVSREILERELGRTCDVLAYPVGKRDAFNEATLDGLRQAGYRAAMSFYGGVNRPAHPDCYDIRRHGVGDQSMRRLRLQTSAVAAFGGGWI